mgnify:CR=1 FL=1
MLSKKTVGKVVPFVAEHAKSGNVVRVHMGVCGFYQRKVKFLH